MIDPHLKWLLRRKLKEIHHELKLSLIYVTHDQVEALTFADQVVVMTQGEVVQVGSAQALFEEPEHTFVGYFIGNPGMNLLPCTVSQNQTHINGCEQTFSAPENLLQAVSAGSANHSIKLGIRPEFVECHATSTPHALPAQLTMVRNMGTHWLANCQLGGHKVAAKLRHEPGKVGAPIWLSFPSERTLYYVNDKRVR